MTNRFTSSSMTRKNIRFRVQIGSYSKHVCKGYYASPEFSDDQSESSWSLFVYVYDGADHENFIDVRLKRENHTTEEQFVNVKMSIVNCFGFNVWKKEKKIVFAGSDEASILSVAKEDLKGYFGLKKSYYLPKDTLTLQCDLVVHEDKVLPYRKEESSLNNILRFIGSVPEYFAHSRLVEEEKDHFIWEIRDFSVHCYGGRCIGPEYQSEVLGEGTWNLAVYNMTDDYLGELIDIRLMHRESYQHQMVKAKLSILDQSGNALLSSEKYIHFTSPREVPLLSLTAKNLSSWFGLNKKRLIPNDKLTMRCDIVLYKQVDDYFGDKEDFGNSVQTHGYALIQVIPYLTAFCFILAVVLHMFCTQCITKLPFIWYYIQDVVFVIILEFVKNVILFLVVVVKIIPYVIKRIVNKAEKIKREKEEMELMKKLHVEQRKMKYIEYPNYNNYGRSELIHYRKPKYRNRNHYQHNYIAY